jgi:hypothetical protein
VSHDGTCLGVNEIKGLIGGIKGLVRGEVDSVAWVPAIRWSVIAHRAPDNAASLVSFGTLG